MELSRDINVAAISAFPDLYTYVDALAATGVQGIRVAKEVGLGVTINDKSKLAYEDILENVHLNDVECKVRNEDAKVLLASDSYDVVDIDPFGSPAPFLDVAAGSAKKLLVVTATDTAPLCGAHSSGIRKYAAVPLKTEYYKETGIRILLGAIVRNLARYDKATKPLLAYTSEHFIRAYVSVERSASKANDSMRALGFIAHCFNCGHRYSKSGLTAPVNGNCSNCGGSMKIAGPMYLDKIHEASFCDSVLGRVKSKRGSKIVRLCLNELNVNIPFHFDHHWICKKMGIAPCSIDKVFTKLRENGFLVSSTHYSGTSFKTNASMMEIMDVLRK